MEITTEAAAVLAGVFALANGVVRLIERLVDGILKKKDEDESISYDTAVKQSRQIEDLWDWHNHDMPTEPGVKCWWNTALRTDLGKLRGSIDRLTDKLEID